MSQALVGPRHVEIALVVLGFATAVPAAFGVLAENAKKGPPIKTQMGVLRDGMKSLQKDLDDPKRTEAALETVLKMEEAVQGAKLQDPPATAKQEKDAKDSFVKDYRKTMIELQKSLLELEAAIVDGDAAKAKELAQKVGAAKGPGHDKFNPKR